MGAKVINGEVIFDLSSKEMVDISISNNPIVQSPFNEDVVCIFRRLRSRDSIIDGNPVIYALKGLGGYHINLQNLLKFMPFFYSIAQTAALAASADYVIPIPSSSRLTAMVSRRVARVLQVPCNEKILAKKLHRHVCPEIDLILRTSGIPKSDASGLKKIRHELGRSLSTNFSLKSVDVKLRKYFIPFKVSRPEEVLCGSSVLLVDDLLSTGTSLQSARDLLLAHGASDVRYLCLLSSTGPYRRL